MGKMPELRNFAAALNEIEDKPHVVLFPVFKNPTESRAPIVDYGEWVSVQESLMEEKFQNEKRSSEFSDKLRTLAQSQDPEIRMEAARNHYVPLDVLNNLAKDPNPEIRYQIAQSLNTPMCILEVLCSDHDANIKDKATENLQEAKRLYENICEARMLGNFKDFSLKNLQYLDNFYAVNFTPESTPEHREKVAKCSKTSPIVLGKLAEDRDVNVRKAVAKNRKIPMQILRKLANDENIEVSTAAKNNHHYKDYECEDLLAEQNDFGDKSETVPETSKNEQDKDGKGQGDGEIGDR